MTFVTTRWTVVLTAGRHDTSRAQIALASLCQAYWFPLYAYVRRRGYSPQDAEDFTQGFFERLLQLDSLSTVHRERGKFRAFLLAAMNHYLADEWGRASAQKRDVRKTIPLDMHRAETRYADEPLDQTSPDRLFERQWALTLLETVLQLLCREYAAAGKQELFQTLRFTITGDGNKKPYAELGDSLGMTAEAARVAAHRLRQRYRHLLRAEIAHTVATEADVEEELHYLRRILAG